MMNNQNIAATNDIVKIAANDRSLTNVALENLSSNEISNLAYSLKNNTYLKELSLTNCVIDENVARVLAEGIKANTSLQKVIFSIEQNENSEAILKEAARQSKSLFSITINNQEFHSAPAPRLDAAIATVHVVSNFADACCRIL